MNKRRTHIHKGKIRFKYRQPRKVKKEMKKQHLKRWLSAEKRLKPIYGYRWCEQMLLGG